MRPLRITARNVVCYQSLDLDVSDLRHVVIVGENGAGKTLLVDLVRVALYDVGRLGPRALAGMFGEWGDTCSVALEFEHGGAVYRSTRTRRRTAKTTSRTDVLQRLDGDEWVVLTDDVVAVLGVGPEVLGATTFLKYRGVDGLGDFGAASPTERKALLGAMRQTGQYTALEAAARARASTVATTSASVHMRVEQALREARAAEEHAARVPSIQARLAELRRQEAEALDSLTVAMAQSAGAEAAQVALARARQELRDAELNAWSHRAARDGAQKAVAGYVLQLHDADKVRAAAAERERLTEEWQAAVIVRDRARTASLDAQEVARRATEAHAAGLRANERAAARQKYEDKLAAVEADVATLEPLVKLAAELAALRDAEQSDTRRVEALDGVPCAAAEPFRGCRYLAEAVEARDRLKPARARIAALQAEVTKHGQEPGPALARMLADKRNEAATLRGLLSQYADAAQVDLAPLEAASHEASAAASQAQTLSAQASARVDAIEAHGRSLRDLASRLPAVETAAAQLDVVRAQLAAMGDGADLEERVRVAREALARVEAGVVPVPDLDALRTAVEAARADVYAETRALAEAQAAGDVAAARRAVVAEGEAELAALALERAEVAVLQRFYREAPQLIAENDRAALERAANDWLASTSDLSLELVFQRPLKSDASRVAETLEVDVIRPTGRAVRETCSGGELFRVDVGLAVGLGRVTGSERAWLCIDEGFGSLKGEVVQSVTRSLAAMLDQLGGLWVVTHIPQVADVFPARLEVRRTPNGSVVEVVR